MGLEGPAGGACERPSENLLDLTGAPGLEYLSEAEILLCSQLHIIPPYYLGIKASVQGLAHAGHVLLTLSH